MMQQSPAVVQPLGRTGAQPSTSYQAAPCSTFQRQLLRLPQHALLQRRQRLACTAKAAPPAYEVVVQSEVGFPYGSTFRSADGREVECSRVAELVQPFVLEDRLRRIEQVASQRTYSVLPILEGVYDMGNLAAVCRTADALGIGAVHYIDNIEGKYKLSQRTAAGSDKWLDVRRWEDTASCLAAVKAAGYQVVVTHLSKSAVTIQEVDWTRPTAVILGNEKSGVSEEAVAAADACAIIPMAGFVESFNISVAAALVMYAAQQQRLQRAGRHADLTQEQQTVLKAVMLMKTVRESPTLLSELLSRPPPAWQAARYKGSKRQQGDAPQP